MTLSETDCWTQRVSDYVNELEQLAEVIEPNLMQLQVQTSAVEMASFAETSVQLIASIKKLETMVAGREQLLSASDAPAAGSTLIEKLLAMNSQTNAELVSRCQSVAGSISLIYEQAISLFVCQYHLANYSSDVIRILSGYDTPPTYQMPSGADAPQRGGGRLFNDAA